MVFKGLFWLPKGILNTWLYPIGIHDETWRPLPLFFWTHHVLFFSRSNGEICPYSRFCLRQFVFIFPGNLPTHGESIVVFFIFWAPDQQIQVHWGPVCSETLLPNSFLMIWGLSEDRLPPKPNGLLSFSLWHGGFLWRYPIAGWFVSWKILSKNGWWLGVPPWLRKPPNSIFDHLQGGFSVEKQPKISEK